MISGLRWKPQAAALLGGVGLIWAVSLYGLFVDPGVVSALALVPRRIDGLPGVLGTLLVHGSLGHLAANTPPLLVLGVMVAVRGAAYYLTTALAITVVGGLGLWVVGRDAAHIGASGLIFGLFGFLVARGYYERRWSSIAAALVVVVLYGGMIAGVVPRGGQVSWEAHLCGLLAGILCAWSLRHRTGDAGVPR
ncbi:MAG: rhomboid family intramembrane serine protease [Acidobacteria bacterium]|nr:rhomboid family intramembrane serine protease [Acidobacteriota bacterium]